MMMLTRRDMLLGIGAMPLTLSTTQTAAQTAVPVSKLIAHRGFGTLGAPRSLAPENTMAAFRTAAATGVTYMETDAQVTVDGQVVLMHDKTVERTTNGAGEVAQMSFAEIRSLDAGFRFAESFRGEIVPTLADYFIFCRARGLHATPEVKGYRRREDIGLMIEVMRRYGDPANTIWCSARPEDLVYLRGALGERSCGVGLIGGSLRGLSMLAALGGRRAMLINQRQLQKNLGWVVECHAAGAEIWPWTVGSTEVAQALLAQGCDMIIADALM